MDRVRWGVWLGRHICYTTTQVSYEELKESRNLLSNKRVEAPLMGRLSTSPHCESMAYRSFSMVGTVELEVSEKLPQG
jgi:hypothetical protein